MPTYTSSIVIDLKSNIGLVGKKIQKALKGVINTTKKVAKGFKAASKAASDFGKNTQNLQQDMKKLAAVAAVVLVGGFSKAVQAGSDFETSLADLSAITGATGEQLQFLKEESIRLGIDGVKSAEKVADAFKLVASANSDLLEDSKGLSKVTEAVILLSNASGLELAQSATSVTQAMNQFALGADEANRAVNVLAAGSKFGTSEVTQTAEALIKAGVNARLAKVSFEETNAAIQVLASGGKLGAEAGTQLRNVFLKLETSGNSMFTPSIVGMSKALDNLGEANLGVAELAKLFNEENIAGAKLLIDGRERFKKLTKQITGTDIAYLQAKIRLATFNKQMEKAVIIMKSKLIIVFEKLRPKLIELKDSFEAFLDTITTREIERFVSAVTGSFSALGEFKGIINLIAVAISAKLTVSVVQATVALVTFGKTIGVTKALSYVWGNVIVKLAKWTRIVTAAQWLWNVALSANPIGLIIIAIGALVTSAMSFKNDWAAAGTFFMDMWDAVANKVSFVFGKIKEAFNSVSGLIGFMSSDKEINVNVNKNGTIESVNASTPIAPAAPVNGTNDSRLKAEIHVTSDGRPELKNVETDDNTDIKTYLGRTTPLGAGA